MKKIVAVMSFCFLLNGCLVADGTSTVYIEPVSPESLLDLSSERVSFTLELPDSVDELSEWVNSDQPTRAEVYCTSGSRICGEAENILKQFGVPFEYKAGREVGDEVVLLYDRVFTRDCEGGTEGLGCSTSANTVQMVVDPRQFLDPALLDLQDAEKASSNFETYLNK